MWVRGCMWQVRGVVWVGTISTCLVIGTDDFQGVETENPQKSYQGWISRHTSYRGGNCVVEAQEGTGSQSQVKILVASGSVFVQEGSGESRQTTRGRQGYTTVVYTWDDLGGTQEKYVRGFAGGDKDSETGAGQHTAWTKYAGGGWIAGTGRRPGGRMTLGAGWVRVGSDYRVGVGPLGQFQTKTTGTRWRTRADSMGLGNWAHNNSDGD